MPLFLEANASLVLGMSVRQSVCLLLLSRFRGFQFFVLGSTVLGSTVLGSTVEGCWRLLKVDGG